MAQSISLQEVTALAKSGNADAQDALSSRLHQRGQFDESMHWLRLAAAQKLRAPTVLMYLNDGYSGGSTYFPKLGLDVKGRRDSLHAGMPVTAGEKWLLSQWIRSDGYPARLAW